VKIFGVMIANEFSSEVNCGSRMVGNAPGAQPKFVVHSVNGNLDTAKQVERNLGTQVTRMDFGWRPNVDGKRPRWAKAASWAKLSSVLPKLIAEARRFDPDFIYSSQQRWDCTAASCIALALGKPQVVHLHYITGPWLGRVALQRLRSCERVVAVSDFTRRHVIQHGGADPDRVKAVLNSIPPFETAAEGSRAAVRNELGIGLDERVAGLVARFHESKGQRESVEAFSDCAERFPRSRLLLVGDGPLRAELEQRVASLGLSGRVIFTGNRRDVPALLSAMDIFVHPSYEDPCPLAVLEAQAAGLPVVAFADGGIPEIVANEESGLLSPTGDVRLLAANLSRLLSDPTAAQRLGAEGVQRVDRLFYAGRAGAAFVEAVREFDRS
jgi:glycosyltransferase involved in cell wall biosynthesis